MSSTVNPLVAEILAGDHDADLDRIDRAIRQRKQRMFRPGTRVQVIGGGSIDGETGVVTKVNLKRISVTLDSGRGFLIPVNMLEVIDE
jgi:hypothetical protein